ncbi:MAG: CPBP family intramembrane metalloprotease [Fibrobacteres bacterium]|nr:CPBP family intramembrane metalloprotease [Fibrobacterota bacterium]
MKKSDLALMVAALLFGAGFLAVIPRLWPMPELPLDTPARTLEAMSREHQSAMDMDLSRHLSSASLTLDESALSWLERDLGQQQAKKLLENLPVYLHEVQFKRRNDPTVGTFWIHPRQGLSGWRRTVEDDEPGESLDSAAAASLVSKVVHQHLGQELSGWELRRWERKRLESRTDHSFVYERAMESGSDARLRLSVSVAGSVVREARQVLVTPPAFLREQRKSGFKEQFVQTFAFALFASLGVAAFLYKLWGLRRGMVGLAVPAIGAAVVVASLALSRVLRSGKLFDLWDPLSPQWMSAVKVLLQGSINDMLAALMVFSFLGAADALDREAPRHRGIALRNFLRLRWIHVDVGHASIRGYLLGWVAGGVLALSTWALTSTLPGALIEIQPRGFFFHGINSSLPTLLLGAFFLQIALVEELGYRHFAGNAILRLGAGRWAAVILPALIYGAVHSGLDFLPPAEPWWARIIPITLVGLLWGLAFLKWDALTVVLSHWACDLFLFNRTRLFSEDPWVRLSAAVCLALPLVPAFVSIGWKLWLQWRAPAEPEAEPWEEDPDFSGADPGTEPDLPVQASSETDATDEPPR